VCDIPHVDGKLKLQTRIFVILIPPGPIWQCRLCSALRKRTATGFCVTLGRRSVHCWYHKAWGCRNGVGRSEEWRISRGNRICRVGDLLYRKVGIWRCGCGDGRHRRGLLSVQPVRRQSRHGHSGLFLGFSRGLAPFFRETFAMPGKHLQAHFIGQTGQSTEPFQNRHFPQIVKYAPRRIPSIRGTFRNEPGKMCVERRAE